jgi:hypothetical protein
MRKLIGAAFLNKAGELGGRGILDFLKIESSRLLPEGQDTVDFMLFWFCVMATERFELSAFAAVESRKPGGELLAGRSLGNFGGGELSCGPPSGADRQAESNARKG